MERGERREERGEGRGERGERREVRGEGRGERGERREEGDRREEGCGKKSISECGVGFGFVMAVD